MACYVDTSAFYAFVTERDRHHEAADAYIRRKLDAGEALFSSSFALCETLGLIQARHGLGAVKLFMERIFPLVEWRWVDEGLFQQALRLVEAHERRGFTIVDACAVACVAERPGSACAAIDPDLRAFGFEVGPEV